MYSTAYQDVVAGRVREDEGIGYFGKNKVTTLAGNFTTNRVGGAKPLPQITVDHLRSTNVGKLPTDRNDSLDAYDPGSNNSSM